MASPLSLVSMGLSVAGGITGAAAAKTNAAAQQINIAGQMMQTIGQAFGMEVQAQQYEYASNIAKYQAGVSMINRDIAKANAAYARDVGEIEAQTAGMKARQELSEVTAAQGASGLDVNVGSSGRVRESMIELGYYNQALIRSSAAKKAYGYEVEATQHEAQADIYRYTAKMNEDQKANALQAADLTRQALPLQRQAMGIAETAGTIGATGSLISAAGSVANKWIQGGTVGLPGFSLPT